MSIKYVIFFDIDHTIYDPYTGRVPASTRRAFEKIRKRGDTLIALATGRAYFMLDIISEIKPFVSLYVTINGQLIYKDEAILHDDPMQKDGVRMTKKLFKRHGLQYGFIGKEKQAVSEFDRYCETMFIEQKLPYPVVNPDFDETHDVYQMWAFADDETFEKIRPAFKKLRAVKWLSDGFDVIEGDKSKKDGVLRALEILSVPLENAYCFGDGENDIEMLKIIPNSVAVGNAEKNVKDAAKHTAEAFDDDGIYNALKRLKFID